MMDNLTRKMESLRSHVCDKVTASNGHVHKSHKQVFFKKNYTTLNVLI